MKKYQKILTVLALICIFTCSIRGAISYFTTYAAARGGRTLHLVEQTRIEENAEANLKKLTVYNTDTNVAVYVRAKAFTPGNYSVAYTHGDNWTDLEADGYCYYRDPETGGHAILNPGKDTGDPLVAEISRKVEEGTTLDDSFNVVVIYEAVPVIYDKDGNPTENWDQPLIDFNEGGDQ